MDRVVDKYYLAIVHGHFIPLQPPENSVSQLNSAITQHISQEKQDFGSVQTSLALQSSTQQREFIINAPIADDPIDPTGFRCCIGSPQNPGQVLCLL